MNGLLIHPSSVSGRRRGSVGPVRTGRLQMTAATLLLVLAGGAGGSFGFSSGAPMCDVPSTFCMGNGSGGTDFEVSILDPGTLAPIASVAPGGQAVLRVSRPAGWKGGLIQSLEGPAADFDSGAASGTFGPVPTGFKFGTCASSSSVTHSSGATKSTVDFPWTAPTQAGTVTFYMFFVVSRFASENSILAVDLDVAAAAAPGDVGFTHRIDKAGSTDLTLTWEASCSASADDFAIYEGQLGDFTSHVLKDCADDGGDLTEMITPGSGNRYYLVVATDGNAEGSYGRDSTGQERVVAAAPGDRCRPAQEIGGCP